MLEVPSQIVADSGRETKLRLGLIMLHLFLTCRGAFFHYFLPKLKNSTGFMKSDAKYRNFFPGEEKGNQG